PDPARMEMHLSADAAGEKGFRTAVFRISDDGVPDSCHVGPKLVRAPGQWLEFNPGSAIACPIDGPPSCPRLQTVFLIDMHLLSPGTRLLRKRRIDRTFVRIGHTDHERPIDFLRGPS